MRYPRELYKSAGQELSDRRQSALAELDRRISHIQDNHPDIWQLRKQALAFGARMGKALIMGDTEQYDDLLRDVQEHNSRISEQLTASGFPSDYLEAPFICKLCEDKGVAEGRSCECKKAILNRLVYEMLSNISRVDECSFESFELDYYSGVNRKTMSKLLEACRRYAAEFCSKSPNLLFMGQTGLGKTHLSLAIARDVVAQGKLVMYASAVSLISRIVDSAMGEEREDEYREIVYKCDLLIIDDLGTEFKTHITKSEVYNLVNTRIIEGRPTIINTNLSLSEIENAYDQRVLSRLTGCYSINRFDGEDIRIAKRRKN